MLASSFKHGITTETVGVDISKVAVEELVDVSPLTLDQKRLAGMRPCGIGWYTGRA